MSGYPERPKFWAMKVIRTLQKTGAANHMGRDAAWLVTTIVALEDVKRYSGPVAFWNSHLMDVTGFGHKGTFLKARAAAVQAGWLVYIEGRKSRAATYWTTIPSGAVQFSDSDVLEDDAGPESDQQNGKCRSESGPTSGPESGPESGPHSYPIPLPIVAVGASLRAAAATKRKKRSRLEYPEHFVAVWNAYPERRRKNKRKAFEAYRSALQRVSCERGGNSTDAATWILQRVNDFAESFAGQNFAPEPERWFRDDRFDDSPESWEKFGSKAPVSSPDASEAWHTLKEVLRKIDKTKQYKDLLRQQLKPEVYLAAETVGFKELFSITEYNESKLNAAFAAALKGGTNG